MRRLIVLGLVILFLYDLTHAQAPESQPVREWTVTDSKAYAKDQLNDWAIKQYKCLVKLWNQESNWRPNAYNKVKVMGRNAGGIPQLLGMSPSTPPTEQIERGLDYIYYRYGTPCKALAYHNRNGWY